MTEIINSDIYYKKGQPTTSTIVTEETYSTGQTIELYDGNNVLGFRGTVYTKEYEGEIKTYECIGFDKELNEKFTGSYSAKALDDIARYVIDGDTNGDSTIDGTPCSYLYYSSSIDPDNSWGATSVTISFNNLTYKEIFDILAKWGNGSWCVEPDGKVWLEKLTDFAPNHIYYHALHNNKADAYTVTGTNITFLDADTNGDASIVDNDGHKKSIKLPKNGAFRHDLTTTYSDITIEFFVKSSDVTHETVFYVRDATDSTIVRIRMEAEAWDAYYSAGWKELCVAADDTWYHVRIYIYDDSGTTKFSVWIDGTSEVDAETAEDNDDVSDFYITTENQTFDNYIDAWTSPEEDTRYTTGDNRNGVTYEGDEIVSDVSVREVMAQVNVIKLYGAYKDGARLVTNHDDHGIDSASVLLHGRIVCLDHYPSIDDQDELDALSDAILARTGMADNPKNITVVISDLDYLHMLKTVRFHFTPFTDLQTADNYYIMADEYDIKNNIHDLTLANALVRLDEMIGQSAGVKVQTADEGQLDVLADTVTMHGHFWMDEDPANFHMRESDGDFSDIGDVVSTWYDIDLSSFLPDVTPLVIDNVDIRLVLKDNAANSTFDLRKNGASNDTEQFKTYTQVANQALGSIGVVGIDSNEKIEFRCNPKASDWTVIILQIIGYSTKSG